MVFPVLKFVYADDIRVVQWRDGLSLELQHADFVKLVCDKYGLGASEQLAFKYTDAEGDSVTIGDEADFAVWRNFAENCERKHMKLEVIQLSATLTDCLRTSMPEIHYDYTALFAANKATTGFTAGCCSPKVLRTWDSFLSKVQVQMQRDQEIMVQDFCPSIFAEKLETASAPKMWIKQEGNISSKTASVLSEVERSLGESYLGSFQEVPQGATLHTSNYDLYCLSREELKEEVPQKKKLKEAELIRKEQEAFQYSIETKPPFKYLSPENELLTDEIVDVWNRTPKDPQALETWLRENKKHYRVYHLVRQVYGHMISSRRCIAAINFYERWIFARHTAKGELELSPCVYRSHTNPSILHCLRYFKVGCISYDNQGGTQDIRKIVVPDTFKSSDLADDEPHNKHARNSGTSEQGALGKDRQRTSRYENYSRNAEGEMIQKAILSGTLQPFPGGCGNARLFTSDDGTLLKISSRGKEKHARRYELNKEASTYKKLQSLKLTGIATPMYYDACISEDETSIMISAEGPDFETIGLPNISCSLKRSAVFKLKQLSSYGLLHRDLHLKNIVQSRENKEEARILDFGHSEFVRKNSSALKRQVRLLKSMLRLRE